MKNATFAALLLLAACGKVGEPRPPIIRILQRIEDLSAAQNGYKVFLNWTNPARYVDGNPATDTGVVHVFRNSVEIGMAAATAPGQPQSFPVDVTSNVDTTLTFTVQLVVPRANKPSPVSNVASIRPVDVPGKPGEIVPTVDQGKIVLVWDPPARKKELADAYLVQRSDKPVPSLVLTPRLVDSEFEAGKTYTYTVTAVRGTNPQIAGDGNVTTSVVATDKTPPATPVGLEIELLGNTAFLHWEQNSEPDLKGYRLFRSDRTEPIHVGIETGYTDMDYVSGKGLSYHILAEDISGNPSVRSVPKPGP